MINSNAKFSYTSGQAPANYVCSECGVAGCKLWRQYNTLADYIHLLCCDCAAKDQNIDVGDINRVGMYISSLGNYLTDQIGWLVPAVPTEECDTYWGYTSIPDEGVEWWENLPTRIKR